MKKNDFVLPLSVRPLFDIFKSRKQFKLVNCYWKRLALTVSAGVRLSGPTKHRASFLCQSDLVLRSMWMMRLGLPMIYCAWDLQNKSTFRPLLLYDGKTTSFCTERAKCHIFLHFSVCLSFNSCGTHLPVFRIFPISLSRPETVCWLKPNCSTSCFC